MKKILIANRGEIAVRIIRACQEMGLKTVAVHSLADKESLHAKLADESVCIGPAQSSKSYLNIHALMSAAELTGADAIHPGYGFLSERHDFAEVVTSHGLIFIGPKPEHIQKLGDKVSARKLAKKIGLNLLPGSEGPIQSLEEAQDLVKKIGTPVIIKATAGGGGRGMKVVHDKDQLGPLLALAQKEAKAGFGNHECYIEKFLQSPRHIEIQVLGDDFGQFHHLGERDCSVQRRHQKLIEETPCPILSEEKRAHIAGQAVALIKEVGYRSLGTVEFLYADGEAYFMEVNTRLQVEHPVTETVFDFDLVKEQINIARGERLTLLSHFKARGHAMECRINAEDPQTFVPWPGLVHSYHEPGGPGIRIDSMLYTNYRVPSHYDSLVAKVIASGKDRMESIIRMRRALKEMKIEGIRTNIPLYLKILEDPVFVQGQASISYMDRFVPR